MKGKKRNNNKKKVIIWCTDHETMVSWTVYSSTV